MQDQIPISVPVLPPYAQFLGLQSYFNSASPTDFWKDNSAMGAEQPWQFVRQISLCWGLSQMLLVALVMGWMDAVDAAGARY